MSIPSGVIYVQQGEGPLTELHRQGYGLEADLQQLLADYPDLIPGEQVDSVAPRRWLLIRREAGVADADGASDRWSLDHLFVDQDAVPTLVEVKRSTDPRARREVVAQMLDYAANSVVYMPVERMRAWLDERAQTRGTTGDALLTETLGLDDAETFWATAARNLQAGHVRLIFVADSIAPELRRIVEFLNGQMSPAEVFAVEVQQFKGVGVRTLVPRLIGQTAVAEAKKGPTGSGAPWDVDRFNAAIEPDVARLASRLTTWAAEHGCTIRWGSGSKGRMGIALAWSGGELPILSLWSHGRVELPLGYLQRMPPYDDEERRADIARQVGAIPGVKLSTGGLEGWPTFDAGALIAPEGLAVMERVLATIVSEVRRVDQQGVGA
jgi:hypothetical protein